MKKDNRAILVVVTIIVIISASLLHAFDSKAQFNQFNATNMLYNPAFAGALGDSRLSISTSFDHDKYSSYLGNSIGSYIGYDQYSNVLRGGIGVFVNGLYTTNKYDASHENTTYRKTQVNCMYSPKIKLGEKYTIAPAIQIGIIEMHKFDPFYEDFSGDGNASSATDMYWDWKQQYYGLTAKAGVLFNTEKFYFGLSTNSPFEILFKKENRIQNTQRDTISITSTDYASSFKEIGLNFQIGRTFSCFNNNVKITPACMYGWNIDNIENPIPFPSYRVDRDKYWSEATGNISLSAKYKIIELGVGLGDGAYVALGVNTNKLRIAYAYAVENDHELSIRYFIK